MTTVLLIPESIYPLAWSAEIPLDQLKKLLEKNFSNVRRATAVYVYTSVGSMQQSIINRDRYVIDVEGNRIYEA